MTGIWGGFGGGFGGGFKGWQVTEISGSLGDRDFRENDGGIAENDEFMRGGVRAGKRLSQFIQIQL